MSQNNMKRGPGETGESPNKRPRGDKFEARLIIPSKVAGSLIGKGGANIQKLRSDNNATVRIPDCPGPERVMTIEGDTIDVLLAVIEQSLPLMTDDAVSHRRQGAANPAGNGETQVEVRVLVHQSIVGGIIGKGGSQIKEIREKSGSNIKVYQTAAPQSTDRCVALYGSMEKVILGVKEVLDISFGSELRGHVQPYDPINYDAYYSNEYGGYGSELDGRAGPFPGRGPVGGRGGMRGGPGGSFGGPGPMGGFGGFRGGRGGGSSGFSGGRQDFGGGRGSGYGQTAMDFPGINDDGEKESTHVTIPKEAAGAIIGPG